MSINVPSTGDSLHPNSAEKTLVGQVIADLGGALFATESIDKVFDFAAKGFPNSKFYQKLIKIARGTAPVIITGHKIYSSAKRFQEMQKLKYARQKKSFRLLQLMEQQDADEYDLDYYEFNVGKEVIKWFLSRPKTDKFKIVDFYDSEFESTTIKSLDQGEYYIYIEYDKHKFMCDLDLTVINENVLVSSCIIHTTARWKKVNELKSIVFGEFINSFDTDNNVIIHESRGLSSRPRMDIGYEVSQFNVKAFKSEIEKAINKLKKRGYIIVGPPGVGKSTVVVKMESELVKVPIIYISSSGSAFREDVANTFKFLRSISPCVAVFEDLDSYELTNKQDRIFGEFIEQMDSLKHQECVIIIATVNEPENIHGSLINRRGRFDKIFFVDFPKSEKEIMCVMKNKYAKEIKKEFPFKKLDDKFIESIIKNRLSHADICELIDHLIINDIEITEETLWDSLRVLLETQQAIAKCEAYDDGPSNDEEEDWTDAVGCAQSTLQAIRKVRG